MSGRTRPITIAIFRRGDNELLVAALLQPGG